MPKLVLSHASTILTNEHDRVLSLRKSSIHDSNPPTLNVPQWVAVMSSAIIERRLAGKSSYELDNTKGELVARAGEYAEIAAMSCAAFNALPEHHRNYRTEEIRPEPFDESGDVCVSSGRYAGFRAATASAKPRCRPSSMPHNSLVINSSEVIHRQTSRMIVNAKRHGLSDQNRDLHI